MAQSSYQKIVLVEDLKLDWRSSFDGSIPVISDINDIEVIVPSLTISLPKATLVSQGQTFIFNNISSLPFDLVLFDGSTVLTAIAPGEVYQIYLIDTSIDNGIWRLISPLSSFNGIIDLALESDDNTITITGSPVSPPSGTVNLTLPTSLKNLNNINSTDFLVISNTNPLQFKTVELLEGENITITNGDGINSNPIINLNTTVTSLSSLTVGDMTLSGNIITNNSDNGNIQLNTNGTGSVQINGISFSPSGNISGVSNFIGASAFCFFTDTVVASTNQIVVEQQVNIASVTMSAGTYKLTFTKAMSSLNYGVFITLGSTGGDLPFISNAYVIVKELTYVTIIVTDASGELVLSAPYGVSVMVMST